MGFNSGFKGLSLFVEKQLACNTT